MPDVSACALIGHARTYPPPIRRPPPRMLAHLLRRAIGPPRGRHQGSSSGLRCQRAPERPQQLAMGHQNDQELEQLQAAVTAEQQRRGKKPHSQAKTPSKRSGEVVAVSLTPGKLSAVRAAFKAGVRPSKIAKQFGIPQSDVRKVLANEKKAST